MHEYEDILVEISDHIAVITLNRPIFHFSVVTAGKYEGGAYGR